MAVTDEPGKQAPYFTNGQWTEGPDIYLNEPGDDLHYLLSDVLGFEVYAQYGAPPQDSGFSVVVYERPSVTKPNAPKRNEHPTYMIEISRTSSTVDYIYTDTLPDLLELLRQLLPIVRDALLIEEISARLYP